MPTSSAVVIHAIRDVTVVNLNDRSILDTAQIDKIGEQLFDLVDHKACRKIILDFSKVQFLASSALGMLLTLRKKSESIKGKLVLCSMRDELRKVFKITKLDKLFTFTADEEEALSQFGVTSAG